MLRDYSQMTLSLSPYQGIYDAIIPANHLLRRIKENIDFSFVNPMWKFSNLGTQTWSGRKLYLSNHDEIRPRAEINYIEIPETPPKTGVEISVVIELRPFEGRTTCHWIMVDSGDNDCYPDSRMFDIDIDIDVKFKRNS